MPRLPTQLLLQGRRLHPLIPVLLGTCRDLTTARNELRWLRDHALKVAINSFIAFCNFFNEHGAPNIPHWKALASNISLSTYRSALRSMCIKRGRGTPLQYIIGTEYFGDLEIVCEPGVLIPRSETADMVAALAGKLVHNLQRHGSCLRILDLCTGTGCMSFLIHKLLSEDARTQAQKLNLRVLGVDISNLAIKVARNNLQRLVPSPSISNISFLCADILASAGNENESSLLNLLKTTDQTSWDILISNPPYISPKKYFSNMTARSVRNFEPRLALVPPQRISNLSKTTDGGDRFYPVLLAHAVTVNAKVVLLEVGDYEQALRVATMAMEQGVWSGGIEVWRDSLTPSYACDSVALSNREITIRGNGQGRCVVCWKNGWL